jgi:hypothetical protein
MIGLKLSETKRMFFDAPAIVRAVDAATRRVLSRFGAFVRRTARTSIRKRKVASVPGSPPSSHTGLLKQFIYFGYDRSSQSVVIGPTLLNAKERGIPERLEYGGLTMLRRDRVTRVGGPGRKILSAGTTLQYKARPYMRPALAKELPKLPAMWRDSVKP